MSKPRDWLVPAFLALLTLVPMFGGAVRLASMGHAPTPESARFIASPVATVVHIFAATLYGMLGALQFSGGLRRRFPKWHRRVGLFVLVLGFAAAVSGVWMTAFLGIPQGMQGPLLFGVRLAVGGAMAASLALGLVSIVRRDVAAHEAWMIRAYALGMGAGTQVFVLLPWMVLSGESTGLVRELLMTLSWALNVAFGEWIIRRARRGGRRAQPQIKLASAPA